MTRPDEPLPDDIAALQGALAAERLARREAETMIAHLKLLIAKMRHERFGRWLDQLELRLEELEAAA